MLRGKVRLAGRESKKKVITLTRGEKVGGKGGVDLNNANSEMQSSRFVLFKQKSTTAGDRRGRQGVGVGAEGTMQHRLKHVDNN